MGRTLPSIRRNGMKNPRTIIVTGASQGLGREMTKHFARSGYSVAAIARSQDKLERLQTEIKSETTSDCSVHVCDLTDENSVHDIFQNIRAIHPRPCALVNNAGTWTGGTSVAELSSTDLRRSLEQNFFSAFFCIQALLKNTPKEPLSIVNIGATASLRGSKNTAAFAVAKASLRILSQSLSRELGPQGVHTAHVILDGLIDNERTRALNQRASTEDFMNPKGIAEAVLHLIEQPKSNWTFELDMRPYNEKW